MPVQITKDNLGGDYPMLAGNLVSICMSAIICGAISLWKPQVCTSQIVVSLHDSTSGLP